MKSLRLSSMRYVMLVLAVTCASLTLAAEFDAPWKKPGVALLIDAFYANTIDWDLLATEPRVVAVIHKATIGTSKLDPGYSSRKVEALKRGYLWGSYHWGVAGDPEKQADFYIDTVKPGPDEMLALDLEDTRSPTLMNVDEAIVFVERIKARTGRYPVLYANHSTAQLISAKYPDSVLAKIPLWYARFKEKVDDFPAGAWRSYTLWQFSSEILPQLPVPGTKSDMDINVFNGSIKELKAAWPLTRMSPQLSDENKARSKCDQKIRNVPAGIAVLLPPESVSAGRYNDVWLPQVQELMFANQAGVWLKDGELEGL